MANISKSGFISLNGIEYLLIISKVLLLKTVWKILYQLGSSVIGVKIVGHTAIMQLIKFISKIIYFKKHTNAEYTWYGTLHS